MLDELEQAGFSVSDRGIAAQTGSPDEVKDEARLRHAMQRRAVLLKNAAFIDKWEDRLLSHFASGRDVAPTKIRPRVAAVATDEDAALFRFASLHWSVPVSAGYGRRTRFLIWDEHKDKLIGLFALGDPVFNLGARDRLIGWNGAQRKARLYNCYDAYVLGAVEPYRYLIAGKLAAFMTVTEETAAVLTAKYAGVTTVIQGEEKTAEPVLISTTSALGRSSIYNRLKLDGQWVFRSIGFTEGFGHFHFSEGLFDDMLSFLRDSGLTVRGHQFGQGPNWRIRTLRQALDALDMPGDLLRHGVKREIFLAPRGVGWRAYLRGETDRVRWFDYREEVMSDFWRERWAVPRARRDDRWRAHKRDQMRLSPVLEQLAAESDSEQ